MPDDPEPGEDRVGCPVCMGKPVRCLVLWNTDVELARYEQALPQALAGMAMGWGRDALDLAGRPDAVCGRIVKAR